MKQTTMPETLNTSNTDSNKKLLVVGLENSGKSSIVLSIIGKSNLIDHMSLNPTQGPHITNFESSDSQFNIWDLGGQESYRDEYLDRFEEYISGCSKILYVIDIQDVQRYEQALLYLEKIFYKIQQLDLNVDVSIFLHKYDPNLHEIHPEITEESLDSLINKVKKLIPKDFFFEIYKSTIYTIFDKFLVY